MGDCSTIQTLDFWGPFKFLKGDKYLFNSDLLKNAGIYLWTIKDELHNLNYVHYVGETRSFGNRQREHVVQIAGLNYRIIDPVAARQGIEKILWNGMWRDKSNSAVATMLDNYAEITKRVTEYIGLINIYFAPTTCSDNVRKHIEGCIGHSIRTSHSPAKLFYPDDNHVGRNAKMLGEKLILHLPEAISGIDSELTI